MKIAVIKRKFLESGGGGAEKYAQHACSGLAALGHDITIIAEKFSEIKNNSYKYIKISKSPEISSSGTTGFHKRVQRYIKVENLKNKFDIIYALSRTSPIAIFRPAEQIHADWLKFNKSKIQILNPRHRGILKLEKNICDISNTKAIVTNSQLVKNLINRIYEYPKENIYVIRNGIDQKKFYPAVNSNRKSKLREKLFDTKYKDKTVLLFAGTNFEIKGLKNALRAISKLNKKFLDKIVFYVIGGDSPEKYMQFAEKLHISEKIHFIGNKSNMRDYYASADLFLFPSLGEPFANVCLEACACGLPVLTTVQNGSSELIENLKNGYIIDFSKNIDTMTRLIRKYIMMSLSEKEEFSTAAVEAVKNYSWKKHVLSLESLFEKLK